MLNICAISLTVCSHSNTIHAKPHLFTGIRNVSVETVKIVKAPPPLDIIE